MALSIHRPAVATPDGSSGFSVNAFFTDKLQASNVVLVPSTFELSGNPKKKMGEDAEKKVIDSIEKCGRDIPGIQIICFHGVRVIGGSPSIIREVDQCCFIDFQGRHYILITEVKCNAVIKTSNSTRKKAITQLKTFTEMLEREFHVPTDALNAHSVWPNMEPYVNEPCRSCPGRHLSLYEKPTDCQQAGTQPRANPEPPGFHVFKDMFGGNEFSNWIKSIVDDPSKAVDVSLYDNVLQFITRHCLGVLYDETVQRFCILGKDQDILVKSSEKLLNEPTVIYGLGGTGKTISIMARIQHISSHLSASSRAIYFTSEDNAIATVKKRLDACNVDLTHITFANLATSPYNLRDITHKDKVVEDLIRDGYRYIYLDSVEDLGVDWVNELLEKTLLAKDQQRRAIEGDFWITFDPYQGLGDTHCLMKGSGNQIHWLGNLPCGNLLEEGFNTNRIVKLETCFRMPLAMLNHIESEKMLPTRDLPEAQDVQSLGVVEENINFPVGYSIQSMAEQLAKQLHMKVMQRGIHPGHCAVVFDDSAGVLQLFPPQDGGLPVFVKHVNSCLRAIPVESQRSHMLQMSLSIEETLLYSRHERHPEVNYLITSLQNLEDDLDH